jgi:tetratricopeptide (TPR) repeat protein
MSVGTKFRVSVCLIVKNEAAVLAFCLRSIADLVNEIIVADTGSTDGTRDIALAHGAKVIDFAWCDSFAAARNECLKHATGDWILWIDGDEFFDEANRQKLRELFANLKDENAAYVMTQRSRHQQGTMGSRVQQVRLFRRRPGIGWEYRVHEQLLPNLRRAGFDVRFTDIVLEHTGYQDPALRRQKLERNLRLLHLDLADRPDDPFTLFNLGLVYGQIERQADAVACLRKSLERCHPGDSIVSKLYAALVNAHLRMRQPAEAGAVCRSGRARCPDDPELLFLDGALRKSAGDWAGAEGCWKQVVSSPWSVVSGQSMADDGSLALPAMSLAHFTDLDEGLVAAAREELAGLYLAQGRFAEAEEHWKGTVEGTGSVRALCGLGELYLAQRRWEDVEAVARRLEHQPDAQARDGGSSSLALRVGVVEGLVLRGRGCLGRQEFGEARRLLEGAVKTAPHAVAPRISLTHALLQEHTDLKAAEEALRGLLLLDPGQAESWRNLAVLMGEQNRLSEALVVCQSGRGHCPNDPELLLFHGMTLLQAGDLANAESALVRLLEVDTWQPICNRLGSGQDAGMPQPPIENRRPQDDRRITARHNLALVYQRQGRLGEAEGQWRAVLAERPDLIAAWLGLAELCLMQKRLGEVESILAKIEPSANGQGTLLRARLHMERKQFDEAKKLLHDAIARDPKLVPARRLLTYALLQEDRDLDQAEKALVELVQLVPGDAEARHNLEVLRRRRSGPTAA